ncbi:MAG: hypothetical protein L0Y71_13710 [Gemmataceae bacterium]|nr:hypothetical protein [Gemmataceae bacterium]
MRSKLLLTLGLAGSLWSAGCQPRRLVNCAATATACGQVHPPCGPAEVVKVGPPSPEYVAGQPSDSGVLIVNGGAGNATPPATEPAPPRELPLLDETTPVPAAQLPAVDPNIHPEASLPEEQLPPPLPNAPPAGGVQPLPPTGAPTNAPLDRNLPDSRPATKPSLIINQAPAPLPANLPAANLPAAILPTMNAPAVNVPAAIVPTADAHSAAKESTNAVVNQATVSLSAAHQQTLSGEVAQFRRGWRLRYAAVDVVDPHGGSVGLDGPGLERLKDGARIRVTGTLVPAEDRHGSARFLVRSLDVLQP